MLMLMLMLTLSLTRLARVEELLVPASWLVGLRGIGRAGRNDGSAVTDNNNAQSKSRGLPKSGGLLARQRSLPLFGADACSVATLFFLPVASGSAQRAS